MRFLYNYFYTLFFIIIDRGLLEIVGPTGFIKMFTVSYTKINMMSTGFLYHYAFYMTVGVSFVFILLNLLILNIGLEYIFLFISLFVIFILC